MSLTINTLKDAADAGGNRVTVDRRMWLTQSGRAVEDGDPSAVRLLCSPGKRVLRSVLEAAGVKIGAGKKRDKAPTEDKAEAPADNKADPTADEKGDGIPGNVKAAKVTIGMADAGDLDELDSLEAGRDGGPRTGVTKALAKRRAELEE